MSATRRIGPPLLILAGLAVLGACGTPGGPGYEVDYFDTGPVGYWPGFYSRPWYGDNGAYVHPPDWDTAVAKGRLPHIPTAARPSRGRPAARAVPRRGERR